MQAYDNHMNLVLSDATESHIVTEVDEETYEEHSKVRGVVACTIGLGLLGLTFLLVFPRL